MLCAAKGFTIRVAKVIMLTRILFFLAVFGFLVPGRTTNAFPQDASIGTPCQAFAGSFELYKYGTHWLQWDEHEREIYLLGLVDGGAVYADFMLRQPPSVRKRVGETTAVMYGSDVLSPVMTSLYGDPANIYIRYNSMVFIARDKIAGKNIDGTLREARQRDCGGNPKK